MGFLDYLVEQNVDKIRILILTGRKNSGDSEDLFRTAGRIKEICKEKGIDSYVAFADEAYIVKKGDRRFIHNIEDSEGFEISPLNTVAIVRGNIATQQSSFDLLSLLERHNIFCINYRKTMEECSDKYRTALILADSGITTPKTAIVNGEKGIEVAFKKIGRKFPVVLKTLTGSKGVGVFIADSEEGLKSTLQTIWKINPKIEIIMQEYLDAKFDVRIHVLGDKIIAAMKRLKIKKDFRSNYSLGGEVDKIVLTPEQEEIAILAAKAVGATWAGVDLMTNKKDGKNYIIEINSSPGTEGIEKATGKDICSKVIEFAMNKKNWRKPTIECGYVEKVDIDGLGSFVAKFDTGNGSYNVIHADEYKVDGDYVTWKANGKELKSKLETVKKFKVGGVRNEIEERPVVWLDIHFNGDIYNMRFSLSNRDGMTTPVLLNRKFIKLANLTVNPAKKYVLSIKDLK